MLPWLSRHLPSAAKLLLCLLTYSGDGPGSEFTLASLAIQAPLLLPEPQRPGAATDAALHVVLDFRDGSVRLQSSAQGRRCGLYGK